MNACRSQQDKFRFDRFGGCIFWPRREIMREIVSYLLSLHYWGKLTLQVTQMLLKWFYCRIIDGEWVLK